MKVKFYIKINTLGLSWIICKWHLVKAWLTALQERIQEEELRSLAHATLLSMFNSTTREQYIVLRDKLEQIVGKESEFYKYFIKEYDHKCK